MNSVGLKILIIGMLALTGLIGLFAYKNEKLKFNLKIASLPIKYVRTEGVFQFLTKDEIKTALQPLVTTGFFEADMQAIHETVAHLPWVETVSVKRVWPDTIDIKVRERKAFVRWGEQQLMTEQGTIFTPSSIQKHEHLLLLVGPEEQHAKVLEIMKGIKTTLADQNFELEKFTINDRWAWTVKLTTELTILLGRENQLEKLQRFLKTLPLLPTEQLDSMVVVDLRYPNGYAVSWLTDNPEIDWKKIANGENNTHEYSH